MSLNDVSPFADRVATRLERLDLTPEAAARLAGLAPEAVARILDGRAAPLRGQRLVRLAEALATSVSYLVGLDPDTSVPNEFLEEDQGTLGLLAGDEEALLRAYRRLDVSTRAALLRVVGTMSPEPTVDERKPVSRRASGA